MSPKVEAEGSEPSKCFLPVRGGCLCALSPFTFQLNFIIVVKKATWPKESLVSDEIVVLCFCWGTADSNLSLC